MKGSTFKKQYAPLARTTGLKRSARRMRSFRKVEGEAVEGQEILQIQEADRLFSLEIRKRDKQCVRCGSAWSLGCSHFISRANYSTRYDPLNCITLCQACHEFWEKEKKREYRAFMLMWLGGDGLDLLEIRSKIKMSPYEAIANFMILLKSVEERETIKY